MEATLTAEDMEGKTEEEIDMMRIMGFKGFDTTKGKKVNFILMNFKKEINISSISKKYIF